MWPLPLVLTAGAVSYALCDVRSGNVLTRALCPLVFTLSLVALAVWIYVKASASDRRGGDGDSGDPASGNDDATGGGDGEGGSD